MKPRRTAFGFELPFQSGLDLTSATSWTLQIRRPDKTIVPCDNQYVTVADRALGTVVYIVQPGDLPLVGDYRLELTDTTEGTPNRNLPSGLGTFTVYPEISDV